LIDDTKENIETEELEPVVGTKIQALKARLKKLQDYLEAIIDRIEKNLDEKLSNLNGDDDNRHNEAEYYEEYDEESTNTVNDNLKKIIRICFKLPQKYFFYYHYICICVFI
jgi:hypothetical protein